MMTRHGEHTDRPRRKIRREREREQALRRAADLITDERLEGYEHHQAEHRAGEDRGVAGLLTILAWLQLGVFTSLAVYPSVAARLSLQLHPGPWPYLVALGCFAPLAFRRDRPVWVLAAVSAFAALYFAMPWPPTIIVAGPMLALYTVAERYGGRRAVPVGVVLFGMLLAVSALSVSLNYTVTQAVGMFALLALSAALGHGTRTRRELFEEVLRSRREESRLRLEEERLGIARDVHDIMAHSLTLMTVQADAGAAVFDADPERAREALALIGDTGRSTLKDLRTMLAVLTEGEEDAPRRPTADLSGLTDLVDAVHEAGVRTSLETNGDLAAVPSAIAVSAYRIVQESLTNVVRHSEAAEVTVRVAATAEGLEVDVADDGRGPDETPESGGRGIRGMRERVAALGGTFSAEPSQSGGFHVSARIPFPRSA